MKAHKSTLEAIATILVGLFAIFAPNLSITLLKKEPTMIILILVVAVTCLLFYRRFIRKTTVVITGLFLHHC